MAILRDMFILRAKPSYVPNPPSPCAPAYAPRALCLYGLLCAAKLGRGLDARRSRRDIGRLYIVNPLLGCPYLCTNSGYWFSTLSLYLARPEALAVAKLPPKPGPGLGACEDGREGEEACDGGAVSLRACGGFRRGLESRAARRRPAHVPRDDDAYDEEAAATGKGGEGRGRTCLSINIL